MDTDRHIHTRIAPASDATRRAAPRTTVASRSPTARAWGRPAPPSAPAGREGDGSPVAEGRRDEPWSPAAAARPVSCRVVSRCGRMHETKESSLV